ncbi:pyrroline-5-carboxylate reductase [Wukongibacter baidiensis]|uniref:pyrroline-5-carboxylate reductase n=1 Tax=Wukongibacter baidiensis TaxID=1723361 RepID=UPI003D7F6DA9
MQRKKILFIGAGMMAEGIIKGFISSGTVNSEQILIYDISKDRMSSLKKTYCINTFTNISNAVKEADVVFVSVRPQNIVEVLPVLKCNNNCIVVSIAAGIDIQSIENIIGTNRKIFRVMPNTLTDTRKGVSGICYNENVSEEEFAEIDQLLQSIGETTKIQESLFNAFSAYCTAGPAYIYEFVEAMIDAGVFVGFSRSQSREFTLQNMLGVATRLLNSKEHPAVFKERMTSPDGTSITALNVLNSYGFKGIIQNAIKKGLDKENSHINL